MYILHYPWAVCPENECESHTHSAIHSLATFLSIVVCERRTKDRRCGARWLTRTKRSKLITESCAPENVILIVRAGECTCRRHESIRVSYWALNQQLYGIQFIDRARTHTPPRRRLFPRNFCDVTFFTLRTIPACSAARTCVLCERERKFSDSTDLEHIMNLPLLLLRTTLPGTYLFISGGSGKNTHLHGGSSLGLQQ